MARGGRAAGKGAARASKAIIDRLARPKSLRRASRPLARTAGKDAAEAAGKDAARAAGRDAGRAARRDVSRNARRQAGNARDTATTMDKRRCVGDPVDVASGDVVLSQTDIALPGILPLVLRRSHISSYRIGRAFGWSWASTLDMRLEIDEAGVCLVCEDGTILVYPPVAAGQSRLPAEGPRWPLALAANEFAVTNPETGITWRFSDPALPGAAPHNDENDPDRSVTRTIPLTAIRDRHGNWIAFTHANGRIGELSHSGGYRVTVSWDGSRVACLGVRTAEGGLDTAHPIQYTDSGLLHQVIRPTGAVTRFDCDGHGRLVQWTDSNGHRYDYTYDERGRCVTTSGSDGRLDGHLAYDDEHLITTATDSLGRQRVYHRNPLGQVVQETDPLGGTILREWDRFDRLLTETDELGATTRYTYDVDGNLTRVTYPDGAVSQSTFTADGLPTSVTGPDGARWMRTYDAWGNPLQVTDPLGATTTYAYDARGHLAAVTRSARRDDQGPLRQRRPAPVRDRSARRDHHCHS